MQELHLQRLALKRQRFRKHHLQEGREAQPPKLLDYHIFIYTYIYVQLFFAVHTRLAFHHNTSALNVYSVGG
jgi:hypothetical protein